VLIALLVKEIKAILCGEILFFKALVKTRAIKVSVLPVPGGPKILTVFWWRFFSAWRSKFFCVVFII